MGQGILPRLGTISHGHKFQCLNHLVQKNPFVIVEIEAREGQ